MSRLASRLALAGALALLAALAAASVEVVSPFSIERAIDPSDIHPLRGRAYAVTLPRAPGWPLFEIRGDGHRDVRSRLQLLEDGRPLPRPHATQASVEARGEGRYLHLRQTELYFSTSDGSHPRSNGKHYSYRAPVAMHAGSLFALFAASGALLASAAAARVPGDNDDSRVRLRVRGASGRIGSLGFAVAACVLSLLWLVLIWQPAPLVVDTGDGGTVASIAAGRLSRAQFEADPVLGSPSTTAFYVAASVPLTAALARWTGDVGQAYALPIAAILLVQLFGFWRLGLRLYGNRFWAALIAALSVPPVYVFTGELWGLLSMPLARSFFGALLPWLLLGLLDRRRPVWRPYALMAACGGAAWIHPVSAPSVAFGIWLALVCDRPPHTTLVRHTLRLIAAGFVFVACVVPIALWLFGGFGAAAGDLQARAFGAQALRQAAGAQYFDVRLVLRQVIGNGWGWVWIVWIAGAVGLFRRRAAQAQAHDALHLRLFLAGVLVSSVGAAAIDQFVAYLLGRTPVQIDLVRNLRFVVPVLLLGTIWLLSDAWSLGSRRPARRAAVAGLAAWLLAGWWFRHPTPPSAAIAHVFNGSAALEKETLQATRRMLRRIGEIPAHSRVLPLGEGASEGAIELTGLAVRYASFRPVSFLAKDLNLLSYSGSTGMHEWLASRAAARALQEASGPQVGPMLHRLVVESRSDYVLLHAESAAEPLVAAVGALGETVATEGPWRLVAVASAAGR